ncbi:MAG TPA: hypothetical protein DCG28_01845 [Lachnospiraceae bacterium]|nr:hypothetical protein [Lachnospiraceae bacterium]
MDNKEINADSNITFDEEISINKGKILANTEKPNQIDRILSKKVEIEQNKENQLLPDKQKSQTNIGGDSR